MGLDRRRRPSFIDLSLVVLAAAVASALVLAIRAGDPAQGAAAALALLATLGVGIGAERAAGTRARSRLIAALKANTASSDPGHPDATSETPAASMVWIADTEPPDWRHDMDPEDAARLEDVYRQAARTGRSFSIEYRCRHTSGPDRWLLNTGIPQFDRTGRLAGFIGTAVDVTDRKLAEKVMREARDEAEAASRTKSEFLANMSHELRTPLNAVIGFSEIMKNELFGALGHPSYREYAVDIYESGHHLLNLINDILDVSKAEAGKIKLREEPVELYGTIASCVRLVRARAESGDVAIELRETPPPPVLIADPRRLKQVLLNILSNAVKFTPPGGVVTVGTRRGADGGIAISIADSGIGIAAEDIPKVLAPFGQVDSMLNREQEGTGLGLPLAKALVQLHDGSLTLDSVVGAGTTVTIDFPPARVTDVLPPIAAGREIQPQPSIGRLKRAANA